MILFKEATIKHLDEIRQIGINTYQHHYSHIWSNAGLTSYLSKQFLTSKLINELKSECIKYYFIRNEVETIGFAKVFFYRSLTEEMEIGGLKIDKIYLSPEHVGHGVGSKFIHFIKEKAMSLRLPYIWLEVLKINEKGIRFYKNLGFQPQGTIPFTTDVLEIQTS